LRKEKAMSKQLNIAVIGRGPLGLSLTMLLQQANCKVTNYFGVGAEHQSTAISNLAIAISGMRFFQNHSSPAQLQELVDAFEDAKIGMEQQLGFLPQHQGRAMADGSTMQHGIFAMSSQQRIAFQKKLDADALHEFAQAYRDLSAAQARRLLACLDLGDRVFLTSPEIPFSQEQHLRILERRCHGVREIAVSDHAQLRLEPDASRKAKVQIYHNGAPAEDDYDFVFVAAGRYLPQFIGQLGLAGQISSRVWKFHNAKLPDDPIFGASVYYDFESHLSIVRHKLIDREGHCLLANLGEDYQLVADEDLLAGNPMSSIVSIEARDAYLSKLSKYYPFKIDDLSAIKVMSCYLIDFSLHKAQSNAFRPSYQPFVYRSAESFPRVILGSCFRSVLSLGTAEKMIQASGLKIRWGGNISPRITFAEKLESSRPSHIVEAP
jgi:hypothetical protein